MRLFANLFARKFMAYMTPRKRIEQIRQQVFYTIFMENVETM